MSVSGRTEPPALVLRGVEPPIADEFDGSRRVSLPLARVACGTRASLGAKRCMCRASCAPDACILCLRDACATAVPCAGVDYLCARLLHSSTLEHLNAVMVDQSAIGRPVHRRLGHAGDTRAVPKPGRVHLFG